MICRILRWFIRIITSFLVKLCTFFFFETRPKYRIPPIKDPILLENALNLANKIRKRQLTCVEVVEAYISRIKEVNGILNAVVVDRFNLAVEEAENLDSILDSGNIPDNYSLKNAPFLGVPFTTKIAFAVKGLPQNGGLLACKDYIAQEDAPVIRKLCDAGAIVLGLTNVSELCMWYETNNPIYGRTNNPYDIRKMVGGSSGGEGSIIAAAGSLIGVGSDIGGSIRMPAFFNGIFGHKPTPWVVSNDGQFPQAQGKRSSFLCTGPMCRYAEDLKPMLQIMANPTRLNTLKLDEYVDLHNLKFVSIMDDSGSRLVSSVDPQLIAAQNKVIEILERNLCVKVERVQLKKLRYSLEIWAAMMSETDSNQTFTHLLETNSPKFYSIWEFMKLLIGKSKHTLPAIALSLLEKFDNIFPYMNQRLCNSCNELGKELENILGENGVLLYPSHPKPAYFHNMPLLTPFNFSYTAIFNVLGLPVTQVPLGLNSEGIPIGIQVVALKNNDRLTLATASMLEQEFGGWNTQVGMGNMMKQIKKLAVLK